MINQTADLEARQFKLVRGQRLETVGELAAGVAHDFNNMLSAMLLILDWMRQDTSLNGEFRSAIREMEEDLQRGMTLARQLLTLSHGPIAKMAVIKPGRVIDDLLPILRRLLGAKIALIVGDSEEAWIEADQGSLEQAIINVVINARDAMPRGGCVTIQVQPVDVHKEHQARNPEARSGQFVRITVGDTGCGISAETMSRIFEPFYTTKPAGKGTGLGLAMVQGFVKQHQGWIEVESELGEGSTFAIYLPIFSPPGDRAGDETVDIMPRGTETILIVEQDARIQIEVAAMLRGLGYQVLAADACQTAAQLWDVHGPEIDLCILDVVLPEEKLGLELALEVVNAKSGLKVILFSDLAPATLSALQQKAIKLAPKPLALASLAKTVRDYLDAV